MILAFPPTADDLATTSELVGMCRSNVMMAIVLSEVKQENVELMDSGPELNRHVNVRNRLFCFLSCIIIYFISDCLTLTVFVRASFAVFDPGKRKGIEKERK